MSYYEYPQLCRDDALCDYIFKVVLTGNSNVGKTSLISKYSKDVFPMDPQATVGAQYEEKTLKTCGKTIKLQLWDTAGQEKFRSLVKSYYRAAKAILLMYDVTNRKSFDDLPSWLSDMIDQASEGAIVFLVGNKIDLIKGSEILPADDNNGSIEVTGEKKEEEFKERKVSRQEALEFARQNHLFFIETSAKTGNNVLTIFETLGSEMVKAHSTTGGVEGNPDILNHNTLHSYKKKLKSSNTTKEGRRGGKEEEEEEEKKVVYVPSALCNVYERKDSRTNLSMSATITLTNSTPPSPTVGIDDDATGNDGCSSC